jgi:hypothetical protein
MESKRERNLDTLPASHSTLPLSRQGQVGKYLFRCACEPRKPTTPFGVMATAVDVGCPFVVRKSRFGTTYQAVRPFPQASLSSWAPSSISLSRWKWRALKHGSRIYANVVECSKRLGRHTNMKIWPEGWREKRSDLRWSGLECCRGVKGNSRRPLANWETQASAICPQRDKSRAFHVPGNGSQSVLTDGRRRGL